MRSYNALTLRLTKFELDLSRPKKYLIALPKRTGLERTEGLALGADWLDWNWIGGFAKYLVGWFGGLAWARTMGNYIPGLPQGEAKGEAQLTEELPFDMGVARDLRIHCDSVAPGHFVQEYRQLYIDMLSAVLCAVLLGTVMRCLRRGRPLNCFERILVVVLSVLLFLNAAVYALAVWRADLGRRCSAHLLLALPLTKGFFWTNVVLWDMLSVQAESGALLSLTGSVGTTVGTVTFGAIVGLYLLVAVAYAAAPLGLSLWAYFTVGYFALFAPFSFLGCVRGCLGRCVCLACSGSTGESDGDRETNAKKRHALFRSLFQVLILFVALASVHLSLIYYGDSGSSFRDTCVCDWVSLESGHRPPKLPHLFHLRCLPRYVFVTKGWVGHFLPSLAELKRSWTWPGTSGGGGADDDAAGDALLDDSASAGDDEDPAPQITWAVTVPLAASVGCVGLSVAANVLSSTGVGKLLKRLLRKLAKCACNACKCAGKCCWCLTCCACCACDDDSDDDEEKRKTKRAAKQKRIKEVEMSSRSGTIM